MDFEINKPYKLNAENANTLNKSLEKPGFYFTNGKASSGYIDSPNFFLIYAHIFKFTSESSICFYDLNNAKTGYVSWNLKSFNGHKTPTPKTSVHKTVRKPAVRKVKRA